MAMNELYLIPKGTSYINSKGGQSKTADVPIIICEVGILRKKTSGLLDLNLSKSLFLDELEEPSFSCICVSQICSENVRKGKEWMWNNCGTARFDKNYRLCSASKIETAFIQRSYVVKDNLKPTYGLLRREAFEPLSNNPKGLSLVIITHQHDYSSTKDLHSDSIFGLLKIMTKCDDYNDEGLVSKGVQFNIYDATYQIGTENRKPTHPTKENSSSGESDSEMTDSDEMVELGKIDIDENGIVNTIDNNDNNLDMIPIVPIISAVSTVASIAIPRIFDIIDKRKSDKNRPIKMKGKRLYCVDRSKYSEILIALSRECALQRNKMDLSAAEINLLGQLDPEDLNA